MKHSTLKRNLPMSAGLKQLDSELNAYSPSDKTIAFILNYSKALVVKRLDLMDAHIVLN